MLVLLSTLALAGQAGTPLDVDRSTRIEPAQLPTHATIINGQPVGAEVHPAAGGILFGGVLEVPPLFGGGTQTVEMRQFICSSTLIAPDVVLAAAHCVDPAVLAQGGEMKEGEFRWSRKSDLSKPASPEDPWPQDAVKVRATAWPDDWDIQAMNNFDTTERKYDISLLFLETPVLDVAPAVLVNEDEAAALVTGAQVEIVGWGMQEPVTIFDSFLPPEEGTFAEKYFGVTTLADVARFEMQVGNDEEPRKCKGDSGGPTFLAVDADTVERYRLVGVTSRSADFTLCAEKGGYDTRVDAYLNWIDDTMRAACDDGTRAWCDEPGILAPTPSPEEEKRACASLPLSSAAGWTALGIVSMALRRRRAA